ncbi:MAG: hypothetical protein IT233_04170 [Bacteroidia bacterium]|nr:hypothetical protein [Bacteroidia bacterium]
MSLDADGFVYVAGNSFSLGTSSDWKIIKYHPDGTQEWMFTYNGTMNGGDYAKALKIDPTGNIVITGTSVRASGNDITTIKLNSSGTLLWESHYDGGSGGNESSAGLSLDEGGNIYVCGSTLGVASQDVVIIKYSQNGVELWNQTFNGSWNLDDIPYRIACDNNSVWVAGKTFTGTYSDALLLKYSSAGTFLWSKTNNGSGNQDDEFLDLTADEAGNIYVTGNTYGSGPGQDMLTVKYSSSGQQKWVSKYNGPAGNDDLGTSIVYHTGSVYVCGGSKGEESGITSYDFVTVKYGSNGSAKWIQRYNGAANRDDMPAQIILDQAGDILVGGSSEGGDTNTDYLVVSYSKQGTFDWLHRYNNATVNGADVLVGIASDELHNVYLTGTSYGGVSFNDIAAIKLAQSGKLASILKEKLNMLMVGLLDERMRVKTIPLKTLFLPLVAWLLIPFTLSVLIH